MNTSLLHNKKILITRPEPQSEILAQKLVEDGAIPIVIPLIEIKPIAEWGETDKIIHDIDEYDYLIFTSANAVFYFMQRANFLQVEIQGLKIVAVGNATKKKLEKYNLRVDLIPEKSYSKEIINVLGNDLKGKKILFPCADIARKELRNLLIKAGALLSVVIVYENVFKELNSNELRRINSLDFELVTLFSPSAAGALCEALNPENIKRINLVCIGETTYKSVVNKGFRSVFVAQTQSAEGIIEELKNIFSHNLA